LEAIGMKLIRIIVAALLSLAALAAVAQPIGAIGADKGKGDIIGD